MDKNKGKMNLIKGESLTYTHGLFMEEHIHKNRETTNSLMPVSIHFPPWFLGGCTNTFAIMGFCEIASFFIFSGCSCSVMSDSLRPFGLQPTGLLCPWDFSDKNTGMCCHFLLQGILPDPGSNPSLLHCRWIFHPLSHWGRSLFSVYHQLYCKHLENRGISLDVYEIKTFYLP